MLWIFPAGKIRRLRSGANPRSWVPGIRSPDRSARSQSLYRLSYPARLVLSTGIKWVVKMRNMTEMNACQKLHEINSQPTHWCRLHFFHQRIWRLACKFKSRSWRIFKIVIAFLQILIICNMKKYAHAWTWNRGYPSSSLSTIFLIVMGTREEVVILFLYHRAPKLTAGCHNTGRYIMFSVVTNIYNNRTRGLTLMELFTATGKLIFFWQLEIFNECTNGWHGTHRYIIQVLATHASTWVHRYSSLLAMVGRTLTYVDACGAKTWITYRCVSCHPWCTHRKSLVVKKYFSFAVAVNNSIKVNPSVSLL
jgi:hypothetical protein